MTESPKLSYIDRLIIELENDYFYNKTEATMEDFIKALKDFEQKEFQKRKSDASRMPFGKYKNKIVKDVAIFDKPYLEWLYKQDMLNKFEELKIEINKQIS